MMSQALGQGSVDLNERDEGLLIELLPPKFQGTSNRMENFTFAERVASNQLLELLGIQKVSEPGQLM